MSAEVLIIGGGVIGLATARELKKRGAKKITILERRKVGAESSFAAAGMLAPQAEADRADDFFRFCRESNEIYPRFAAELAAETGVDIELDGAGTLYLAFTETDAAEIARRGEWQRAAHLAVEKLSAEDVRKIEPFVSPDVRGALFFPHDWQVENRKLISALKKFAELNDVEIIENAAVEKLILTGGKIVGAQTKTADYFAGKVVLATGAWSSLIKTGGCELPLKVKPVRGQMLCFQTAKRLFSKVIYSPRGYLVPRRDNRILAGATIEDVGFDKNTTAAGKKFLREKASEIAPSLANLEIADSWAGLRPFAPDGLPVLGAIAGAENLLLATAHYRNGILLAPRTAEIIAAKILDDAESDYLNIFGACRFAATQTF